jgi:predicted RNA-binding Zn ribbon-like protein
VSEGTKAGILPLLAGSIALDFANTSGGRDSSSPIENLRSPADLLAWVEHAHLLPTEAHAQLRDSVGREQRFGARLLSMALDLRNAIYEIGAALAGGRKPARTDLAVLKDYYQRSLTSAEFVADRNEDYVFEFASGSSEFAVLGPIAASCLEILFSIDKTRIKQCPAHDCGWLFIDSSKNKSRRWCDMATCGNRVKGLKHRGRHA